MTAPDIQRQPLHDGFRRPGLSRIAELEAQVRQLQNDLQKANEEIKRLNENRFARPTVWNGRPVTTCAAVATARGVSLSTVSRNLTSGHWQGEQWGSPKQWLVYEDQPFPRKRKAV